MLSKTFHRIIRNARNWNGIVLGAALLAPAALGQDAQTSVQNDDVIGEAGLAGHNMRAIADPRRASAAGGRVFAAHGNAPVGTLALNGAQKVLGIRELDVDVQIDGITARTTVKHVFENDTPETLEGVFTFPLPDDAAVDRFAMTINSETDLMEGSVAPNQSAHTIYTNLVNGTQVDPGILEYAGGNLFRATVFPIPAHKTKTIVVSFLQNLQHTFYSEGRQTAGYCMPMRRAAGAPAPLRTRLHAAIHGFPRQAAVSSSLGVRGVQEQDGSVTLSATAPAGAVPDHDWIITIDYAANDRAASASKVDAGGCVIQAHKPDADSPGVFALTLAPQNGAREQPSAADVIFMINTSAGEARAQYFQSIELVRSMLESLSANDRFAILSYDIAAKSCPGGLQSADVDNIARAVEFLKSRKPLGATDTCAAFQALKREFANKTQTHVSVVMIGDPVPTFGALDFDSVRSAADDAFKALNSAEPVALLLEAPAANGSHDQLDKRELLHDICGCEIMHVSANDNAVESGRALAARLCAPMLRYSQIQITTADGAELELAAPAPLGIPLDASTTVFAAYDAPGKVTVSLLGRVDGQPVKQHWTVDLPAQEKSNGAVEKLWAHARAESLELDHIRGEGEAAALGVAHHLLTRGTAFLVLESEEMFQRFRIEHTGQVPADGELAGKFISGRPSEPAETDAAALQPNDQTIIGAAGGIKFCAPLGMPVNINGVQVDVSLQAARVCEIQKQQPYYLNRMERIQRRLAVTRQIAAVRCLPFEPETVYPEIWLQNVDSDAAKLEAAFSAGNDAAAWNIVGGQPDTWHSALTGLTRFDEGEALLNPEKLSSITFSGDGSSVRVETHLLGQRLISTLLRNETNVSYREEAGPSELRRLIITRRSEEYALNGVPAQRASAAFMLLSQIAVVEGQSKLAEELAARAGGLLPHPAGGDAAAVLQRALAAELRADYAEASRHYRAMIEASVQPLVKTGREMVYEALIGSMSMGGDADGVVSVLEKWCAEERDRNGKVALALAHAYLNAGRSDDALRAASTLAQFDDRYRVMFTKADGFMTLLDDNR